MMVKTQRRKYDEHKFVKAAAGLAVVTFLILIGFIIWYFVAGPGSPDNNGGSPASTNSDTNTAAMRLALLPWRLTNQGDDLEIGKFKTPQHNNNDA